MKGVQRFFNNDSSGGTTLIIVAAIAILLANMESTRDLYRSFLLIPVELRIGSLYVKKNIVSWTNDALMTIYFLLVGFEVKRELTSGSLTSFPQACFPVIAAVGGMIVPALIYQAFNFYNPVFRCGWAIPAATDIAFSIGVLTLLGKRVPIALKTFLMALAIIDDIGSMIIIAMFYTNELSSLSLVAIAVTIIILLTLNLCKVQRTELYVLIGIVLWAAVLKSGVHATLSGVITGFFIPSNKKEGTIQSPAQILEHMLQPWVSFFILPLFAFTNAGIFLKDVIFDKITFTLPLGIIIGLVIGKPVGISMFCWLALKLQLVILPKGISFKQIMFVSVLCGIGFTMSIFISTLAFGSNDPHLIVLAKLGALIGSILAATFGYILLRKTSFT